MYVLSDVEQVTNRRRGKANGRQGANGRRRAVIERQRKDEKESGREKRRDREEVSGMNKEETARSEGDFARDRVRGETRNDKDEEREDERQRGSHWDETGRQGDQREKQ